jgi:hypothetical protein
LGGQRSRCISRIGREPLSAANKSEGLLSSIRKRELVQPRVNAAQAAGEIGTDRIKASTEGVYELAKHCDILLSRSPVQQPLSTGAGLTTQT